MPESCLSKAELIEYRRRIVECHASMPASEIKSLLVHIDLVEQRNEELREALDANELDARWIVGQWQRLRDEPTKEVALSIVRRCRAALDKNIAND